MDIRGFGYKLTTTHIDASGNDLRYEETDNTRISFGKLFSVMKRPIERADSRLTSATRTLQRARRFNKITRVTKEGVFVLAASAI